LGYYIVEGIDGCGKDVQADMLAGHLIKPVRVAEPDDTLPTGKLLRQCLKDGTYPEAHAAMFLADRMALLSTKVRPALEAGKDVVSARSWMSTLVYQQDQWPLDWLMDIHRQLPAKATHLIVLDLDAAVALERVTKRPGHTEYYETLEKQERNRARYLHVAKNGGAFLAPDGKVGVIDGSGTPDEVHGRVVAWLDRVDR
jgi:dTMP kinase